MTVTVSGAFAQTLYNDSTTTATVWETIIDTAINILNTYGAGISNLSGTTGSKSLTATSAQAGAIWAVTQQVYSKHYKNASGSNANGGPLSLTYSNDNQLLNFAKQLAGQLKPRSFLRTR